MGTVVSSCFNAAGGFEEGAYVHAFVAVKFQAASAQRGDSKRRSGVLACNILPWVSSCFNAAGGFKDQRQANSGYPTFALFQAASTQRGDSKFLVPVMRSSVRNMGFQAASTQRGDSKTGDCACNAASIFTFQAASTQQGDSKPSAPASSGCTAKSFKLLQRSGGIRSLVDFDGIEDAPWFQAASTQRGDSKKHAIFR